MLRIGRIQYANCTPIFQTLQKHFPDDKYEYVHGVPSALNTLLHEKSLHVCPSSSIEYARHPDNYLILPDISISSKGAVKSVLLFSTVPIEDLDGSEILLSSESATSVNLLKIILSQHIGCNCTYQTATKQHSCSNNTQPAFLLIGDNALKTSLTQTSCHVYDLGELWNSWTGLPFVFALWICTVSAFENHWQELCKLNQNLKIAKIIASNEYDEIAELSPDKIWMGKERLVEYWQNNISYELSEEHIQGLQLFYEKSFQQDLIPDIPKLNFMP